MAAGVQRGGALADGRFGPTVLVTQCGVDSHRTDPLADLGLTVDGHRTIYRTLRDLAIQYAGGKWLALGGGGYDLVRVVPRSWTHLLATILDRDVEPSTELPRHGWTWPSGSRQGCRCPRR